MEPDPQTLFLVKALLLAVKDMYGLAIDRCKVNPYGPNDNRLLAWMTDVRAGDLVVESSSLGLHPQRVGRLFYTEEHEDHTVYFVVGMYGEVMRWENCSFLRIPDPFGYPKHDQDKPEWKWKSKNETGPWKRDR